jgi:hypothetical protein
LCCCCNTPCLLPFLQVCIYLWNHIYELLSINLSKNWARCVTGSFNRSTAKRSLERNLLWWSLEHFCTMEWSSPCWLCWVKAPLSLLGWARWLTQHNGQGWCSMRLRSVVAESMMLGGNKFMFNRHFSHYYKCMIICGRLSHITWSRKWHNLPS